LLALAKTDDDKIAFVTTKNESLMVLIKYAAIYAPELAPILIDATPVENRFKLFTDLQLLTESMRNNLFTIQLELVKYIINSIPEEFRHNFVDKNIMKGGVLGRECLLPGKFAIDLVCYLLLFAGEGTTTREEDIVRWMSNQFFIDDRGVTYKNTQTLLIFAVIHHNPGLVEYLLTQIPESEKTKIVGLKALEIMDYGEVVERTAYEEAVYLAKIVTAQEVATSYEQEATICQRRVCLLREHDDYCQRMACSFYCCQQERVRCQQKRKDCFHEIYDLGNEAYRWQQEATLYQEIAAQLSLLESDEGSVAYFEQAIEIVEKMKIEEEVKSRILANFQRGLEFARCADLLRPHVE